MTEEEPEQKPIRKSRAKKETTVKSLDDFVVVAVQEENAHPKTLVDPKEEILTFVAHKKYTVRFPNRLVDQQSMYCVIHNEEKENYVMLFENDNKWSAKSSLNSGLRQKTKPSLTNLQDVLEWADEQLSTDYKKNRKIQILREFRQKG